MSSLMYTIVNDSAPQHLTNNIYFSSDINERITRNTDRNNLYVPRANFDLFKQSLQFNGPVIWNKLNPELRHLENIQSFKKEYKMLYWS